MKAFETYDDLTRSFVSMFETIVDVNSRLHRIRLPTRCHITTMTFVASLSKELTVRHRAIEDLRSFGDGDPFFTTIGPCAFSNTSAEFHSESMPSVRTKVFNKGALQITGCKSHVEAMYTVSEVCRVLSAYAGERIEAVSMHIALINLNVTVEYGIRLTRFAVAMRDQGILAEQPERPPSCILKIPSLTTQKVTSVIVYKPGKFVICGAPTPEDVAKAYELVMRTFDVIPELLEKRNPDAVRRGRGHYTWTQLVACGMPGAMHDHKPTSKCVRGCLYCKHNGNFFMTRRT